MDESERYKGVHTCGLATWNFITLLPAVHPTTQFDFTSDDVPERDDRVVLKAIDEIRAIMKTLDTEMVGLRESKMVPCTGSTCHI